MPAVLVIDDAPAVAASLAHDLAAVGHRVRVALTVGAALAELASERPDAVVLDHHLDGDASLLRHALAHARLPVLVVSGLDDDVAPSIAAAHGWPYLSKPPDAAALVATVAALLTPETPMSDPRPSIVPDASDAPRAISPRAEAPLPAPPPVAQITPSGRPVPPVVVQAIDRLGDIVGVIAVAHLCALGKIGGVEACIVIGAILGLGTGLRQAGARAGVAPGLSVVGLLVLGVGRWLAPAAGAAELARVSGMFGLVAALVLGGAGCGSTDGATAALATATTAIKAAATVRQYLCARELDPLLGDPRPAPASSGGTSPLQSPTAPPVAPAAPPPAPAPAAPSQSAASDAGAPAQDGV